MATFFASMLWLLAGLLLVSCIVVVISYVWEALSQMIIVIAGILCMIFMCNLTIWVWLNFFASVAK